MEGLITNPLLNLISERQLADPQDIEAIQGEHNLSGESVNKLLNAQGVLDTASQLEVMAEYLGTDVIDVSAIEFSDELLELIPAEIAKNNHCIPIGVDGETLHLCLVDPLNPTILDDLAFQLNKPLQVRIADPAAVQKLIDEKYSEEEESYQQLVDAFEASKNAVSDEDSIAAKINKLRGRDPSGEVEEEAPEALEILEEVGDEAPIVRFVNMILYQALKDSAADIHFEPFEDTYQIRMKVDGSMKIMTPPPKELAPAIASRLKIMAGLNIAERRIPQDGRIQETIAGLELVFRMSTLPTKFGESVVLRLLDSSNDDLTSLEALSIPEKIDYSIRHCVEQPNGVFLVTGPTGSGKTTTLYACLRMLNTVETKILTAEDPVEFPVEGIVQCHIVESMGMSFAKALKSFLRQDPDIILVGEMRDLETAAIGIEAALTGHLVVSTLHTNSSTEAITRLLDMGVEPFMISSSVNGILAQRLCKTICPKCKVSNKVTPDQQKMLRLKDEEVTGDLYYGTGCDACSNTGYRGRRGIYEALVMNDEIRNLIADRTPALELRDKCVEAGMQTLRIDGLRLMFEGTSTFEEVMKYT
ncbi:MAG TPA: pilus assembly protein PilB [Verrucomicrobiales bacterium]|nr:pilus assembly protein PilB [Verrucomicrobiales bacterium]HBU60666.1 pilus assembly protein PilB [Verrucomicrobiales bacterium]|tara:strand:+ start:907 stop:2667 length:1761 start_codon:yes stop_codon:yes gene_type:complete